METPPVFQEAPRCDVCSCTFSAFRRRHHCRSCGRTLCHDHSSNQMALPQFGIYTNVRVCSDCFNNYSRSGKNDNQTSTDGTSAVTDKFRRLNVGEDVVSNAQAPREPVLTVPDCKCGMPLCICEAPIPDPVPAQNNTVSVVQPNPRPKKPAEPIPRKQASSSSSKPSPFFNLGQASNGSLNKNPADYDISGEGLREAIKNSDVTAVKKLLNEGVDANYCDKQGMTLLHLAALFNQTDIVFILMDHGANAKHKNAQGETPIDCAPAMLQHKMVKKMEESNAVV
ncbi:vacuolar protein sorting-associated protein 27 [Asparagus officinalis]|uniref:vacuolar protein sorting-associated protein 27 n=1 Tax=Asparagus officinalis TaxID=4686 RepID=UPI00098E568E|nr:vacuolar protein sorting-associated protein 27 [Asparagus officinalis]